MRYLGQKLHLCFFFPFKFHEDEKGSNNIYTVPFTLILFFLLSFPICKNGEINSAQLYIYSSEQCLAQTGPCVSGSYCCFWHH